MRHMARVTKLDVFQTSHRVALTNTEVSVGYSMSGHAVMAMIAGSHQERALTNVLCPGRYGNQNMANYPQVFNFSYNEDVRLALHAFCKETCHCMAPSCCGVTAI